MGSCTEMGWPKAEAYTLYGLIYEYSLYVLVFLVSKSTFFMY